MKKRIISTLLAIALFISLMPSIVMTASAAVAGIGTKKIEGGQRDFRWPVPGNYGLSGCYIDEVTASDKDGRSHYALDIKANKDTSVVASYPGTVIYTYTTCTHNNAKNYTCCNGFGNNVVLYHENYKLADGSTVDLFTRYSHLTNVSVKTGVTVSAGTQIGTVGSTGYSQGFHLDFQILQKVKSDEDWRTRATYGLDPYINELLELPSDLAAASSDACCGVGKNGCCCKLYVDYVKELYKTSGYITECTPYPCAVKVKITEDCYPYTQPCNPTTASEVGYTSEKLTNKPINKGEILTADALYKNTEGNYWYHVTLSDGSKAYLYSTHTEKSSLIYPWVDGGSFPSSITGTTNLQGTVTTGGSRLDTVQALVYKQGTNSPILKSELVTVNASTYPLKSSTVDKTMVFGDLANYGSGYYTLKIDTAFTTYYADDNELDSTGLCYYAAAYDFYYGQATVSNVTVTFNANGGSCSTATKVIASGSAIGTLPTPTRAGYDFAGWYGSVYSGADPINASTTVNADTTYYALWANRVYDGDKITFDTQGGTLPDATNTLEVTSFNAERSAGHVVIYNCISPKVATNQWGMEIAVDATGKIIAKRDYEVSDQLTVPSGGFVFSMHSTATNSWEFYDNADIGEYLGYYTSNGTTYVSHYDSRRAYLNNHTYLNSGDEYGCLPLPSRDGYLFHGWFTAASGSEWGSEVTWDSSYCADTLYAHWVEKDTVDPAAVAVDTDNDRRYELYDQIMSWTDAKVFCESLGGHLVTITSEQEQQLIVDELLADGRRGQYYIGATDEQEEGSWVWITGESIGYTNWDQDQSEPSGYAGENYGSIIAEAHSPYKDIGEWNDMHNEDHNANDPFYDVCNTGFICEFEQACNHIYYSSVIDATCEDYGYTVYTCIECGDYYTADYVDPLGHSYASKITYPTCTDQGYTTYTCHCGERYVSDYTDALGHVWDDGIVTVEPSEDSEGEITYTCKHCAETYSEVIPALDHVHRYETSVSAPTCTERGYTTYACSCGDRYVADYVDALGHNFTDWMIIQEPTADEDGLEIRTCIRCGHEEQRTVTKPENPDMIASGTCGINLVWTLSTDGYLTISGAGAMFDFGSFDSPWFDHREQILSIVIEQGATSIGNYAFNYCANVTSIQIPNSVTVIGDSAFDDCSSLPELELPDGLVSIGSHAFYDCSSMSSIEIPASVTTIGNYAFWDCSDLQEIVVESANKEYSSRDGVLYNKQRSTLITYPAGKSGAFIIPDSVNTISDFAFYNAEKLSAVTIPDHVTDIGNNAFRGCKNLTTVEIPAGISAIPGYMFCFCESLSHITIPSNISVIENNAFAYCDSLLQITFDSDAPKFEEDVFLDVTAEARYPANNSTWTVDTMRDYGGTITWVPYDTLPFTDVSEGAFYYDPVMWAIENGITNGTTPTTFSPNDQCMRAHVVTFLWRAYGCPEPQSTDNPFVDVKSTDFYYKPVLWALEKGITAGLDATHFGPTAYCNRAQVVTFLYRAMGSPNVTSTKNPFTDVPDGQWFTAPVLWAVENGITNGLSATSFGPNTICNRAQIVTFLYRAFAD